ncbi:unnamed protein product [Blepharisma stoltei]|uniref:Kinesin-like protein n=1 Tax=Blepharisma stoltei TaxID=1481888 RepID=A0AAU9IQ79_9CILI|nr:unnamed protein product [Blepharisma stoltei]
MEENRTRIEVVVRVRPILPEESRQGLINSRIQPETDKKSLVVKFPESKQQKRFKFDDVFDESSTQEELFARLKLNSLVKKVVEGFNATVFTYGPTGSGKTFTMEGYEYDKGLKPIIKENENIGLVPRTVKALFDEIKQSESQVEYTVNCTYIQIYNENIYDLLNPAQLTPNSPGLKMRWNKSDEFYVENLCIFPCFTYQEALSHFNSGLRNKIMASHNINSTSSRSHSIFSLNLEALDKEEGRIVSSRLQLVDLAGSEKTAMTGNEGLALKESIEINKALFTLRQVITTLAENNEAFVPYRNSKLTSLLKQSIGGNSYCLMIACISPIDTFFEDNHSTLNYAIQAGSISNIPVQNIDPKTKIIRELKKEIKRLKKELDQANSQLDFLSEIASLDRKTQKSRLQEMEKLPLKSVHIKRIRDLRKSLELSTSFEPTPVPHTAASQSRGKTEDFPLSQEVLSEKLYDSVKMIRELMAINKKLKEQNSELLSSKKNIEAEFIEIQSENQELKEKTEMLETILRDQVEQANGIKEVENLQKEKKELEWKIAQLEKENKNHSSMQVRKSEWDWKSKRTVLRDHSAKPPKVFTFDRNEGTPINSNGRSSLTPREKQFRTSFNFHKRNTSNGLSFDSQVKQEALSALSNILGYKQL